MANFDGHKQKVCSVTVLRTGRLNDRCSIPGTSKSYFYFRKLPERFRDLNGIVSYCAEGSSRCLLKFLGFSTITLAVQTQNFTFTFIHSIGMCRMRWFLTVLRSFFHSSLLCTFSHHSSPPSILQSPFTSSCRLFLGLPLNLHVPKFIHNTLLGILFLPFSVHAQTNLIYLTLLSLLFNSCINFFIV